MLLNTDEVAKQLWMTPYTVRKYVRRGLLAASRLGKHYLITQAEVDRLLEEMRSPKVNKGAAPNA